MDGVKLAVYLASNVNLTPSICPINGLLLYSRPICKLPSVNVADVVVEEIQTGIRQSWNG